MMVGDAAEDRNPDDTKGTGKRRCCNKKYCCAESKCGCCCCCVFWAPLVFILLLFLSSAAQTFPATRYTNVEYTNADGTKLYGYLAKPDRATANVQVPAALVFHAWNGMSDEVVYFADKLAAEGYYALAPDLFRNTASESTNILWNVLTVIMASQTQMDSDADAAYDYLKSLPGVDGDKVVSGPGFCYGGSQSLIFGSRHKSAAVVTLYGSYVSELEDENTAAWGQLPNGGPILGLYGRNDNRPSVDDVEKFKAAMEKKNMQHTVSIYDNVGHAFVNPTAIKDENAKGHQQAVDGWAEVVDFFHTTFAPAGSNSSLLSDSMVGNHEGAQSDTQPYSVPFLASLRFRFACAIKCAGDMFFPGEGHNYPKSR